MTTTEKLIGITAQHNEIVKRVGNGSLDPDSVRKALQQIIEGKFSLARSVRQASAMTPSWYVSPQQQLERVKTFLEHQDWGFSSVPPVPEGFVPRTATEVLMLNVRLPKKGKQPGLHRTFDTLWQLIEAPNGYNKWRMPELKATAKLLRQAPGYGHEADISWIGFDPNAYQGLSPEAALKQSKEDGVCLAGTEVLMAAWLFPDWVTSWDGRSSPYPNLSGIQFYWDTDWSHVPYLVPWDCSRHLDLNAVWADYSVEVFASPSVREC